jgi:hypothetical protein
VQNRRVGVNAGEDLQKARTETSEKKSAGPSWEGEEERTLKKRGLWIKEEYGQGRVRARDQWGALFCVSASATRGGGGDEKLRELKESGVEEGNESEYNKKGDG